MEPARPGPRRQPSPFCSAGGGAPGGPPPAPSSTPHRLPPHHPPTPPRLSLPGHFVLAFRTAPDNVTRIDASVPDIRLSGLTKYYGEVAAVAGIDLEIARGEFFTMLGPSGSGKTTTLRMIAGFEDPTEGTIELAGEDVSGVPPYDRAVNTVFQDYALFPHMTVGENVAYGLRIAGVAKAERA